MNEFDVKPGLWRKVLAGVAVVAAIFDAVSGPLSARLIAAAALLFACDFAFIPGPPLNTRLGDVHAMARRGWKVPWSAKIMGAAGFVLLVTGIYLQWQGR